MVTLFSTMVLSVIFALSAAVVAGVGNDLTKCSLQRNGDDKCTNCLTHGQCKEAYDDAWFCCPYMKKCVNSSSMPCYYPIATCSPPCHDATWPLAGCDHCKNEDFPNNWLVGCTNDEPVVVPTPSPTPPPTTMPVTAPTGGSGDNTCEEGFIKGKKIGKAKVTTCFDCILECKSKGSDCVGAHFKKGKKKGKCQLFSNIKNTKTKKGYSSWKL